MIGLLGEVDLPAPIGDRWFEDYVPGSVFEFGYASLSETEIVAFARDYDPQSIHTDPDWSAAGPFDGLIASAVCIRSPSACVSTSTTTSPTWPVWPRPASMRSGGRDRCGPVTACASASPSPRRVRRAPSPTGDWCTPRWRHSARTTPSCCRSPR